MSDKTWREQLKVIFDDLEFTSPEDVTPKKFEARLDQLEHAEIAIPDSLSDGLNELFESMRDSTTPGDGGGGKDDEWQGFVRDLWALAYLDHHGDPDQEERWLKAYPPKKWAEALPEEVVRRLKDDHPDFPSENWAEALLQQGYFTSEELTRLLQRFVYRNVAKHYESVFHWQSTMFPGWII